MSYTEPTPIQKKAIPLLLEKKDLIASSQTGTGKSAAFILPMLQNLTPPKENKKGADRYKIDALILAPTRELILQLHQQIQMLASNTPHQSVALYGGIKLGSQIQALRTGANIAVGTTHRTLEHIKNGTLNLSKLQMIVLDEADKMLEMGFLEEIITILKQTPTHRHTVMFSATFTDPLRKLAKSFMHNPIELTIAPDQRPIHTIEQAIVHISTNQRLEALHALIEQNPWDRILIFANTKRQVDQIVTYLKSNTLTAVGIHGDKSQNMRTQALLAFKERKISILVATDVAARGIDITELPVVINFELPQDIAAYIHRIGRTGRANQKGVAISLICEDQSQELQSIQEATSQSISLWNLEGFKTTPPLIDEKKQPKRREKKEGIDLKKAKEIAQKMMNSDKSASNQSKNRLQKGSRKPRNKRHF